MDLNLNTINLSFSILALIITQMVDLSFEFLLVLLQNWFELEVVCYS